MAKLYFRYGAVNSAKTLNLLAVAHNYRKQGKRVLLIKPAMDIRFGEREIASRAGLTAKADLLVQANTRLEPQQFQGVHCVLVDEAQFLSEALIEQLRDITIDLDIPVICYGLRADFKTRLFEGSKRIMELADSIEEVKTTCAFCNRKGIMNLKHINGLAVDDGPSIDLGADEKYFPACYSCYRRELRRARERQGRLEFGADRAANQ
ncbi:MAG: thymidine kinase [Candidatus Dadabacteria bacterium]|nr:MAG: thymidine kinase [Candidatus Dadabacteria bacterium]